VGEIERELKGTPAALKAETMGNGRVKTRSPQVRSLTRL
jgi:hypothetical protein